MPADARIQNSGENHRIPAFAGMTEMERMHLFRACLEEQDKKDDLCFAPFIKYRRV